MRQLLIIADDLSGAADCANACMSSGLSATVTFEDSNHHLDSEVLSVDCDTRHLEPHEAAARVAQFMDAYASNVTDLLIFKKVDSTLRGNVGAELSAALRERRQVAHGNRRIVSVMAPAFPAGGRTTVDGHQRVHGKPLHETEMWIHNRLSGPAHIPTLLSRAGLKPSALGLELVRSGNAQLQDAMLRIAETADVLVCDVVTDDDLRAIAEASLVLGRQTLWAGSAGLAHHLPHVAGLTGEMAAPQPPEILEGPTLFVIGSMSSVSHVQSTRLATNTPVATIHISPRVLLAGAESPRWREIAARVAASLQAGRDTLVKLDGGEWIDPLERRYLTNALGAMFAPVGETVGALVASGGETARAILDGWGITSLQMVGEVEAGLPYSVARIGNRSLPVLTKAGAFGSPETLMRCWDFLNLLERGGNDVASEPRKS
jgi:uncharacterized protein YgbK (DUF1537 family)